MGSEITALGSGITDQGTGIISFFRDQVSGCTILEGSGTKIGHAFGIKDQKICSQNGISDEKTYFVTTLALNRHLTQIRMQIRVQIRKFLHFWFITRNVTKCFFGGR